MGPIPVTSTPSRIHPKVKKHKEGTYFKGGAWHLSRLGNS